MSNVVERGGVAPPAEWDRVERTVRKALDDRDVWRRRAMLAEKRVHELEAALRDVSSGRLDPMQLSEQAHSLERENRILRDRLAGARDTVERILTRLKYAEDER